MQQLSLKYIMLTERNPDLKFTHCIISFIQHCQKGKMTVMVSISLVVRGYSGRRCDNKEIL